MKKLAQMHAQMPSDDKGLRAKRAAKQPCIGEEIVETPLAYGRPWPKTHQAIMRLAADECPKI